jgi:hypothetical protein
MGEYGVYVGPLACACPIGPTEANIESINENETIIKSPLLIAIFMPCPLFLDED